MELFSKCFSGIHRPKLTAIDFIRYIGPGMLVTVGFIDPGNWASNIAAGSGYGYALLWMVTLSTLMLILLQHNAAHLGIVTGKCLSEAATEYLPPKLKNVILISAMGAAVSTAMAELLGGAIALQMLFGLPVKLGTVLVLLLVLWLQFTNSYRKIEKIIIGFVSLIGFAFIYELHMVQIDWGAAGAGWVTPAFPKGALPVIMSVLGAVVMPHNLFLHSEIIQSRQWNLQDETVIRRQLKYEFGDTLFSMLIGWAINSAMILTAAAAFFQNSKKVDELGQAQEMLRPLLGDAASIVFALALLFAGISSSITAGMAGGSIFAGMFSEPYDISDSHSKTGVLLTMVPAAAVVFLISSPFQGLIYSQMLLSVQLPITIFTQIYLTSSKRVMGKYANSLLDRILLWITGGIVTALNLALLISAF
ncbi:Divalent metal cation transporter MntH [Caprobacter fermentans]|uniref:Divalent metal cation transporter MntH n=1 Tax=Caproicibacter fermentans TaxID=2576756 RepID=A0A6N8HYB8_9FIRM|nr:Nramp family divalent metal transporter [Caproicibacter fermentans]MVB10467.1 Divalent metal cation transporter MntH [Caproicibacter fermentans]OCN00727.1 Mg2+/Co2+ transporter [Clostridium sp. W14A]QNK41666.1 Nramp family divalent metal transporter [Caproicibacter fermentans]